jgi:hypothetical protein
MAMLNEWRKENYLKIYSTNHQVKRRRSRSRSRSRKKKKKCCLLVENAY